VNNYLKTKNKQEKNLNFSKNFPNFLKKDTLCNKKLHPFFLFLVKF